MVDGENRGPVVLTVTVVVLVLATIFVALRMISRFWIVKRTAPDDYFMLLAWIISFGLSFAICYGTSVGLGRHQDDIPVEWASGLKKAEYVFSVLYNPCLMATKTSLLLFYLKLSTTERIFRWATYFTLAIVNLAGFALTMLNILQCRPIAAAFMTPTPTNARCENIVTLYLSSAPVNIITDLAILFLPMPILTSMRLPRKQKIILIVTFGVGFFVAVIDVVRIAYLQDAATARLAALQSGNSDASGVGQRNDTDVSWYASLSYMWSAVEVNVGIMCACVPGLKPLVTRFLPTMLRDMNRNTTTNSRGSRNSERMNSTVTQPMPEISSIDEVAQSKQIIMTAGSASSQSRHSHHSDTEGPHMGLMDFLTTPDMTELPHELQQMQTRETNKPPQPVRFFDFVEMKQKKSMVDMTVRESLFPNIMVTVLFLIWGIAYGFLDSLNSQFQTAANMTAGMTVGNHCAYFGAYAVGPLTFGRLVLKHWGFKACYIVGLCIYACGVLVFWPSAVLTSFPAFLVSNLLVGLGLSTLEIAANPFVALCGPQQYMEIRLNLSQGVQAIGSVVSPLLAQRVLFKSTSSSSLIDVQWTYLGIALFTVALAVIYYYVPLPEATDAELERAQAQRADYANVATFRGVRIIWISLGLGIISQFCYVGAQESISTSFNDYVKQAFHSPINTNTWSAAGHSCFAVGRFLAAGLNFFIKARHLLLFYYCGALVLAAVAMQYSGATPQTAIMLLYFFEGPIFSLVFATSLRGLGRHTKNGASFITAAISGGAAWPPIVYAVARGGHKRYQYAYCVVVAAFAAGLLYPLWLNAQPMARKLADPLRDEDNLNNLHYPSSSSRMASSTTRTGQGEKSHGQQRKKNSFVNFKHKKRKDSQPAVEHVEQASPTPPVALHIP